MHWLENAAMRVGVNPAYGARVTSLVDKVTGRDWIAPGGESRATGEDAIYLAAEAVGWDECFPTVSPWDASNTTWGRSLRDHGDLWGRPWTVDGGSQTVLTASYATDEFHFARTLELRGKTLDARYSLRNAGHPQMQYMWALHGLLAVNPSDRIELPGVSTADATYLSHRGRPIAAQTVAWPGPDGAPGLALDRVHPASEQFAGKFYVGGMTDPVASIGNETGWLDIAWDRAELDYLGVWLNYGGWPSAGGAHHIAIEPTTAAADHLGQAITSGTAMTLAPGASRAWGVSLTLRHGVAAGTRNISDESE